ncbi:MAG: recombinase RecF, partial [Proteobacteria bacterium]|nr:recombinase RecF [Pseudomonadota bacterium]
MAVHLLSELIHMASDDAQIIAATQSSVLVDYFEPDDIIVVERVDGASRFKRLCNKELEPWLEKYSLGDLWRKNNIGGGPWGA